MDTIYMVHAVTGAEFEAHPEQVGALARSGWEIADRPAPEPAEEQAEVAEEAAVESGEPEKGPTVAELQDELRALGKPVSGTKPELVERLEAARAENEIEE